MNLVADYQDIMSPADFQYPVKFFLCPYSARRIMGRTLNEHFHLIIHYGLLNRLIVHGKIPVVVIKLHPNQISVPIGNHIMERIVYRCQNHT